MYIFISIDNIEKNNLIIYKLTTSGVMVRGVVDWLLGRGGSVEVAHPFVALILSGDTTAPLATCDAATLTTLT